MSNERDSMAVQNEYADNLLREKKLANSIGAKTDNLRAVRTSTVINIK